MRRLPIFEELPPIPVDEARSIDYYWAYSQGTVGVIDARGYMTTEDGRLWERPLADKDFQALRDALKGRNLPDWVTVQEDQIKMDFSKIHYNLDWLKTIITNHELGVRNSRRGLVLYQKKVTNGQTWYVDQIWRLKDVTVEALGLVSSQLVSLTANSQNPDEAEWETLYFAS